MNIGLVGQRLGQISPTFPEIVNIGADPFQIYSFLSRFPYEFATDRGGGAWK